MCQGGDRNWSWSLSTSQFTNPPNLLHLLVRNEDTSNSDCWCCLQVNGRGTAVMSSFGAALGLDCPVEVVNARVRVEGCVGGGHAA